MPRTLPAIVITVKLEEIDGVWHLVMLAPGQPEVFQPYASRDQADDAMRRVLQAGLKLQEDGTIETVTSHA